MIVLQYFDGCPNAEATMRNLQELQTELGISDDAVLMLQVPDIEIAEQTHFQGSPTILVNGIDIYSDKPISGHNYACRLYNFGGQTTGIIPKDFIKAKLKSFYLQKNVVYSHFSVTES